jgi:hypothetical protein
VPVMAESGLGHVLPWPKISQRGVSSPFTQTSQHPDSNMFDSDLPDWKPYVNHAATPSRRGWPSGIG